MNGATRKQYGHDFCVMPCSSYKRALTYFLIPFLAKLSQTQQDLISLTITALVEARR